MLARWHHPQLGFISPDIFIPLAEENGLMGAISKVIINKASQELAATDILGRVIKHVSVNVSATEFNNVADMHALIAFIKQETKLAPFIRIEITETATLSDMSKSTEIIAGLQAQGVTLSIDDFGTGYTSLAMLKDLTVDELKIDRSFIAELEHDQRSRTIVSAVIAMAEKFNINTVAEGIETEVQLEMLKAMGCNEAQGFLLGRPMPLDALLSHINKPD